jgi:hypothetical protein
MARSLPVTQTVAGFSWRMAAGFMLITEPEETMLALMTRITHGWTTARFARIFFSV